jgi:hypothetical protein
MEDGGSGEPVRFHCSECYSYQLSCIQNGLKFRGEYRGSALEEKLTV